MSQVSVVLKSIEFDRSLDLNPGPEEVRALYTLAQRGDRGDFSCWRRTSRPSTPLPRGYENPYDL